MIEWGPVIAAGIGATASTGNAFLSNWLGGSSSKKAQKRAYNYWKSSLEEGPLLTRKGLEAAGYNPMLALGSVGGQQFSANPNPSFAPVGDVVGSAREGARLGYEIAKGIKLENEKKELENANLKSDLDTKEVQRLQMEANRSLLESQEDRTSLAYGRDIVGTAVDIANTAGSLYSAKAMRDLARQPKESITTIHHGGKDKPTEIIKSHGVPAVDSSAKGSRPSVAPHVGSSAKSAGGIAKEIAQELLLLTPVGLAGAGIGAGMSHIREREMNEHIHKSKDKSRRWYHNFDRFHFDY